MFTLSDLKKIAPTGRVSIMRGIVDNRHILFDAGINTPKRLAHFLAQAAHETAGFRTLEEYGGSAYFTKMYDPFAPSARGRKRAKRLGNTQRGDGARFHGRGIFQYTGRYNYRVGGRAIGVDLERYPEKASLPVNSVKLAVHYWNSRGLNRYADRADTAAAVKTITKRINGGYNGLSDRREYFRRACKVLGVEIKVAGKSVTSSNVVKAGMGLGGFGLAGIAEQVSSGRQIVDGTSAISQSLGFDPVLGIGALVIVGLVGFIVYDRWFKSRYEGV
ncbi:glycoside hydrolase family 19 protein [Roseibium aggregatum]|uniref:Putative chitinase n=1 Tax=Roseibium aggregatum TaxID=187304 RepID=A0A0M6Y9U5_9HYPH|nr:glycoside hydrolase family 19 protein [Roseibium aggregatum]CTQ45781.1 putative chitinase [Roseibium aggregatum]